MDGNIMPQAGAPAGSARSGAAVLVVEDDPTLAAIVRRNLEARGYRVRWAGTAAEAQLEIAAETPAVMLLDVNLPDGSGWDVLRALGAAGRHVPTVVLSAVQVSRSRLAEFRPEACLPKPFPLEALLGAVERLSQAAPLPDEGGAVTVRRTGTDGNGKEEGRVDA